MHLRFGDSDEEGAAPPPAAVPVAAHAGLASGFECVASVRTDFDQKDQCYVFELAHSPGASLVAAALSNRRIKLFNFR